MVLIVSSSNQSELEDKIEYYFDLGYVAQGGVSTCVKPSGEIVFSVLLIDFYNYTKE